MFIGEAAVAAQLGHSNIVHVFDFGQLEGRYFIAMEYVPGVTLRIAHKRMVARGERLPVTTVLHVMMDVCDALEHVHAAADGRGALGLVHRDISPDNVIISTSGSAKLIDFGAARATARTPPDAGVRRQVPLRRAGADPASRARTAAATSTRRASSCTNVWRASARSTGPTPRSSRPCSRAAAAIRARASPRLPRVSPRWC